MDEKQMQENEMRLKMHIRKKKSIAKVRDGDREFDVELKVLKRVYD